MFEITTNKGFHMTFENGWTVSVQWGAGSYSSNRNMTPGTFGPPVPASPSAEIAAWDSEGHWYQGDDWDDNVSGYNQADDVAKFIAMIQAKP